MHRKTAIILAALLTISVVGCGGTRGGAESPKSGRTGDAHSELTGAQLRERAAAVCRRLNVARDALLVSIRNDYVERSSTREQALSQLATAVGRAEQNAFRVLDALEPPAGLQRRYEQYVSQQRQELALQPSPDDVVSGRDVNAVERARVERSSAQLAKAIGFENCSGFGQLLARVGSVR